MEHWDKFCEGLDSGPLEAEFLEYLKWVSEKTREQLEDEYRSFFTGDVESSTKMQILAVNDLRQYIFWEGRDVIQRDVGFDDEKGLLGHLEAYIRAACIFAIGMEKEQENAVGTLRALEVWSVDNCDVGLQHKFGIGAFFREISKSKFFDDNQQTEKAMIEEWRTILYPPGGWYWDEFERESRLKLRHGEPLHDANNPDVWNDGW